MLAVLGEVSTWATGQGYEPAAVNAFLQVADLPGRLRVGTRPYRRDPRDRVEFSEADQDPRRLYRSRHQVRYPLRDA